MSHGDFFRHSLFGHNQGAGTYVKNRKIKNLWRVQVHCAVSNEKKPYNLNRPDLLCVNLNYIGVTQSRFIYGFIRVITNIFLVILTRPEFALSIDYRSYCSRASNLKDIKFSTMKTNRVFWSFYSNRNGEERSMIDVWLGKFLGNIWPVDKLLSLNCHCSGTYSIFILFFIFSSNIVARAAYGRFGLV